MICKICEKKIGRTGGHFNNHLKKEHNLNDYEEYVLKIKYKGIRPLCKCGCGKETSFLHNDFNIFFHGHNSTKSIEFHQNNITSLTVKDLYLKNISIDEICSQVGIKRNQVYNILKKFGVTKSYSESKKKFYINESIFEKIDTEEKAYWLGFLYADGYNNTDKNSVTLCLSNYDYDVLEKFKLFIDTNKKIRKNNNTSSKVVIENLKISSDLNKHGMIKNKTHFIKYPKIDKKLNRHFIRGYFDGDGCITYGKILNKNATVSLVSTKEFLEKINDKIKINFSFNKRHKDRNDNILTISTGGINNILVFFDYIYTDSHIYMDRKFQKFKTWIDFYLENVKIRNKTKKLLKKINYEKKGLFGGH